MKKINSNKAKQVNAKLLLIFCVSVVTNVYGQPQTILPDVDICIYGGTSAGVIAGYTARKLNKTVLVIEPGNRLGGLSSGGLGFTDIGNKYVVTGLARDFYRRIGQHYGKFEQWTFEPKIADSLFKDYVKRGDVKVLFGHRLSRVHKKGTNITSLELEQSTGKSSQIIVVRAKEFLDCTYEGDLMAKAGVSYTTGREANAQYQETVNGVQMKDKHQFPDNVDPYKIPGQPASGLLWGISAESLQPEGTGDKKMQAYNFRLCLTNQPDNRITVTRPDNYDSTKYELLLRYLSVKPSKDLSGFLKVDLMPNHKTDINNNGPFSTDMIGMNYAYPEASYAVRDSIFKAHEDYTKGFLYFASHDARMPEHLRKQMLEWGYPKDEYLENDHWTPQMYIREARRMLGAYVMTQSNCEGKIIVNDGIGKAAYTMDSHNAQRVVVNGMVKNEGDVQLKGVNPYPVSYRSITPKKADCTNLLVPVCLSASHMAYGSIRMEPVFMVLSQSAIVAAIQAINNKVAVQDIDVRKLQADLQSNPLADNSLPEMLVDNDDKDNVTASGKWTREISGGYGPSFLVDSSSSNGSVKFSPLIASAGKYQIYFYYPKLSKGTSATKLEIFDGKKIMNKTIYKKDVEVVGQTSGEWVSLGIAELPAGKKAYVSVSNQGADGSTVADAVLFVPVR